MAMYIGEVEDSRAREEKEKIWRSPFFEALVDPNHSLPIGSRAYISWPNWSIHLDQESLGDLMKNDRRLGRQLA